MDRKIFNHIFDDELEINKINDEKLKNEVVGFQSLMKESFDELVEEQKDLIPPQSTNCDVDKIESIVFAKKPLTGKVKEFYESHIVKDCCPFCNQELGYIKKNKSSYKEEQEEIVSDELMKNIHKKLGIKEKSVQKKKSVFDLVIQFSQDVLKVIDYSGWIMNDRFDLALVTRNGKIDESKDKIALTRKIDDYKIDVILIKEVNATFKLMISLMKEEEAVKAGTAHLLKDEIELEFIELSNQTTFNYTLRVGEYVIIFKKENKLMFEFSLLIKA